MSSFSKKASLVSSNEDAAQWNGRATGGKNVQTDSEAVSSQKANVQGPVGSADHSSDPESLLYSSTLCKQESFYGGRSLRYRRLEGLKPWQVRQWHLADERARQLGYSLNTFVTIFWAATYPGTAAMAQTFKKGMKRAGQWFRDNKAPWAYIYVHENPGDIKPNSHILLHVPRRLKIAFNSKVSGWFEGLDRGVQVDPRRDPASKQDTRLQYMAKGADDPICRIYGGRRQAGGQGTVTFKRAGVAQMLNSLSK